MKPPPVQAPASQQQVAEQLTQLELDHPWSLFCAWLVEDCEIPLTLLLKSCLSCWSLNLYSCPSPKNMKLHGDGASCLLEIWRCLCPACGVAILICHHPRVKGSCSCCGCCMSILNGHLLSTGLESTCLGSSDQEIWNVLAQICPLVGDPAHDP